MAALAATVALLATAIPATAVTAPVSSFLCVSPFVFVNAPTVWAQQWAEGHDAFWRPDLWVNTASGWQVAQVGVVHSDEAMSSDATPGSTGGYAGPWWFSSQALQWYAHFAFVAQPGYEYAVKNVVWETPAAPQEAWAELLVNGQPSGMSTCWL